MRKSKGFFDELMDDFAATIDMQAAIEASRDENGKIDVAKATGISMGLGHMSGDIVMMGAMLGAEGAFDNDDTDDTGDLDADWAFSNPIPLPNTASSSCAEQTMTEETYEKTRASILKKKRVDIAKLSLASLLLVVLSFYLQSKHESGMVVFQSIIIVFIALMVFAIFWVNRDTAQNLDILERTYRQAKEIAEKNEQREQAYNELRNHAGTQDVAAIFLQIKQKMNDLFDNADKTFGFTEPSFQEEFLSYLCSGLFYLAVKDCDCNSNQKASLYDRMQSRAGIQSEWTGNMFFPISKESMGEKIVAVTIETYAAMVIAACKTNYVDGLTDFTKTVLSSMIVLGEQLEKETDCNGLGNSGLMAALHAAIMAMQRAKEVFDANAGEADAGVSE